ncbi:MAG: hypothetical protein ABEH58_04675 [Haloplanus sp.]
MQDPETAFGRGESNARVSVDKLIHECGLDAAEIEWRKEFAGSDETDTRRLADLEDVFRALAGESQRHASDIEGTVQRPGTD